MNMLRHTSSSIAFAAALALSIPALAQTPAAAPAAHEASAAQPAGMAQMRERMREMRHDAEDCMMGDEVAERDFPDTPVAKAAPGMMGMPPSQGMAPGMARMARGMGMRGEACDMPRGGMMKGQGKPGMKMQGCRMMGGCMADKRLDALEKRLDMMQMMLEMLVRQSASGH